MRDPVIAVENGVVDLRSHCDGLGIHRQIEARPLLHRKAPGHDCPRRGEDRRSQHLGHLRPDSLRVHAIRDEPPDEVRDRRAAQRLLRDPFDPRLVQGGSAIH